MIVSKSPTIASFAADFLKVQAELPVVKKTSRADIELKSGGKMSYRYADLVAMTEAARPILAKHNFMILQPFGDTGGKACLQTLLLHVSGEFIEGSLPFATNDADPRKTGSIVSFYRRYSLAAMLGMVAENEDSDAAASYEGGKKVLAGSVRTGYPTPARPPQGPRPPQQPPAAQTQTPPPARTVDPKVQTPPGSTSVARGAAMQQPDERNVPKMDDVADDSPTGLDSAGTIPTGPELSEAIIALKDAQPDRKVPRWVKEYFGGALSMPAVQDLPGKDPQRAAILMAKLQQALGGAA